MTQLHDGEHERRKPGGQREQGGEEAEVGHPVAWSTMTAVNAGLPSGVMVNVSAQ
jgi:hypothetical protein